MNYLVSELVSLQFHQFLKIRSFLGFQDTLQESRIFQNFTIYKFALEVKPILVLLPL